MTGTIITLASLATIVTILMLYARVIHWTCRAVIAEAELERITTKLKLQKIVFDGDLA